MCTCIACFVLSDITPLSRLLQTPCLDFGIAHHHVESLLVTLDSREADAAAVFHSVVFEQAREIAQVLFIQPSVPRSYQRRHGQTVLDPEMFYREQVFLPFVRELSANIAERLSVFGQPRIQLLTRLRPYMSYLKVEFNWNYLFNWNLYFNWSFNLQVSSFNMKVMVAEGVTVKARGTPDTSPSVHDAGCGWGRKQH